MVSPLNLLVLRCRDVSITARFYESLGHQFAPHRHGTGVEHLASETPLFVLELYPAAAPDTVGLGFVVDDLNRIAEAFRTTGFEASPPRDNPWGRTSVVRDPDGRRVELTQRT